MTTVAPQEPHAPTAPQVVGDAPDDRERYASWVRRVIAWLFDAAVVAMVSFLGAGRFASTFGWIPWLGGESASAEPATGWALGASAVLLALQAWTGHTPGKRAVHIAVVSARDGRPLGVVATIGREILHLVDAFLMIGFLRPLWHRRRRTFADSIVGSDVVVGRPTGPLLWVAWLQRRIGRRLVTPKQVTDLSTAICLVALAAAVLVQHGTFDAGAWSCGTAAPAPGSPRPALLETELASPTWTWERRLGVERSRLTDPATLSWNYVGNPTALTADFDASGRPVSVRVDLDRATATVDGVPARFQVLPGTTDTFAYSGEVDSDASHVVVTLPTTVDLRAGGALRAATIAPGTGSPLVCAAGS